MRARLRRMTRRRGRIRGPLRWGLRAGLGALFIQLGLSACGGQSVRGADPLLLAAAASLQDVGSELARAFEEETGVPVELNFAGSNTLARQIESAPRADVFISANPQWVDWLAERKLVLEGSSTELWTNRLVVVGRADCVHAIGSAADLAASDLEHLALADPDGVPAGRYAREWLESNGAWDDLLTRVAPCLDVRAALALALADRDVVSIVYATDAAASTARILYEVPADEQPAITYTAALVQKPDGLVREEARAFMEFVQGEPGRALAKKHGFLALER